MPFAQYTVTALSSSFDDQSFLTLVTGGSSTAGMRLVVL